MEPPRNLTKAQLEKAVQQGEQLEKADLRGAQLQGAKLKYARQVWKSLHKRIQCPSKARQNET